MLILAKVASLEAALVTMHTAKGTELFREVIAQQRAFAPVANMTGHKAVTTAAFTHDTHNDFLRLGKEPKSVT